ncbi:hypothetical protein [Lichenicoccus sp.]|uniref:hypothetical protein n=1 Tax=Lichenicoccus sp. TaxID=2781899 RepID=UPI003D10F2D2
MTGIPQWLEGEHNRQRLVLIGCLAAWLVMALYTLPHLFGPPKMMGDSSEYLSLAANRPPLYGWVVLSIEYIFGGIRFLPLFQFCLISSALVWFAVEFGLLLGSVLAGPLVIGLSLLNPGLHDTAAYIESEPVDFFCVFCGFALLCRFARRGRPASLVVASFVFALSAATRTTGAAFMLLPLALLACDRRIGPRPAVLWGGLSACVMVLVLLVAMAGNWLRNDRFEIGSYAGVSLIGKALLVAQPGDIAALPKAAAPAVAATLSQSAWERHVVAHAPDLASAMRAQMQAAQDIRFPVFAEATDRTWPALRAADARDRSHMLMPLALSIIKRHPVAYAKIWLRDWGELLLYPNYWPSWATAEAAPYDAFPGCAAAKHDCYALDHYNLFPPIYAIVIGASVAGAAAGIFVLLRCAVPVLRRRAGPQAVLFFWFALVLHASLAVYAAFEAGFVRYTELLYPMEVTLLLWLALRRPTGKSLTALTQRS